MNPKNQPSVKAGQVHSVLREQRQGMSRNSQARWGPALSTGREVRVNTRFAPNALGEDTWPDEQRDMKRIVVPILVSGCAMFTGLAANAIELESWSWWVLGGIALGFGIAAVTVQVCPDELTSRVVRLFSKKARQDAEVAAMLSLWENHGFPVLTREMASASELAGTGNDGKTKN